MPNFLAEVEQVDCLLGSALTVHTSPFLVLLRAMFFAFFLILLNGLQA